MELYKVAPKHPVPLNVAAEEWGFTAKSSSTKTVAAALKRFGLVRDVGAGAARQLELTDDGRELAFLSADRGSPRWQKLVTNAALRPKIHRQVLDHFGGPLPDDRVVLRYLLFDLGFLDEGTARDFLRRVQATLDFAGIQGTNELISPSGADEDDDISGSVPEQEDGKGTQRSAPASGPAERTTRPVPPGNSIYDHIRADRAFVQIPYSHGEWATLQAGFPLTEAQWDALIAMLQAMKPGLVSEAPDSM